MRFPGNIRDEIAWGHHLRRCFDECAYQERHFVLRTSHVRSADVETLWIEPVIDLRSLSIRHISKANICCTSMDRFR